MIAMVTVVVVTMSSTPRPSLANGWSAIVGASNYTFAEATWTQALPDRIASHVRAFQFYGGCAELVNPDDPALSRAWS